MTARVLGRVQGVMFRDHVRRAARALSVTGEIENMPDGTVRLCAEGTEEALLRLIEIVKKGSMLSRVDDVQYQFVEPTGGFDGFYIKYD